MMKTTVLLIIAVLVGAQYSLAQRPSVKSVMQKERRESKRIPCQESGTLRSLKTISNLLAFNTETGSHVYYLFQEYARPGQKAVGRVVKVDDKTQELTLNVSPCETEPHHLIFKPPYEHQPVERQCSKNGPVEILSLAKQKKGKIKRYKEKKPDS